MVQDAFAMFGLPRQFDVDADALRKQYLQRCAASHPDRFTDPAEQAEAAAMMAALNEAFQTLRDPIRRAEHLLALLADPVQHAGNDSLDPEHLALLMDLSETAPDATTTLADRDQWQAQVTDLRTSALTQLRQAFEPPAAPLPPEAATAARRAIHMLRALDRLAEQAGVSTSR